MVLLLAAVGAGIWLWQRAGESTPVSEDAALEAYREGGGAGGRAPGIPAAGRLHASARRAPSAGASGPAHLSRDLPGEARYVVTAAPGGYREELDISKEHIEGVTLRVGPKGAAGGRAPHQGHVPRLRPGRPPGPRAAAAAAAGQAGGGARVVGELPRRRPPRHVPQPGAERADALEVDGRRYKVWVVRSDSDTGGVHPGTRTDAWWWSPAPRAARCAGPSTWGSAAPPRLRTTAPTSVLAERRSRKV